MKKKNLIVSIITLLALWVSLGALFSPIPIVQAGSWYTVNNDPYFYGGHWEIDLWSQGSTWHDYSLGGGTAMTRAAIWSGFNVWGNTEYQLGKDFWKVWGTGMYEIPLTIQQQVVTRGRVTEEYCSWNGVVNMFGNWWIEFSEPVGPYGLTWAELIVYFSSKDGWLYPWQWNNSYKTQLRVEPEYSWYMVSYRVPQDIGGSWTTKTVNLNNLINLLTSRWGIDISKGMIKGIAFGIEGANGEMTAEWDYYQYQVNM